jgi:hypothetical protein
MADFNGLFGNVLCLSHDELCTGTDGNPVPVHEGMRVVAIEPDMNTSGEPDNLIAVGTVGRPRTWLTHTGSRWVMFVDDNGIRHESDPP